MPGKKESKKVKREESDDDDNDSPIVKKQSVEGDAFFSIGGSRKVIVGKFKSNLLINIREFYEDKKTSEEKPGKIGIALTKVQWEELKTHVSIKYNLIITI
jgi:hypothetical protein